MSLRGFAQRMNVTATAVADNTNKVVRKCALAVDQTVVMATPVDTGRARSNWVVSLDTPATGEIPAYVPGKGQSTAGANAQAAIDQGKEVIDRYNGGVAINITNNLDYIGALNDGSSRQAPANFVEEAVRAGVAAIQGASILVTKS